MKQKVKLGITKVLSLKRMREKVMSAKSEVEYLKSEHKEQLAAKDREIKELKK